MEKTPKVAMMVSLDKEYRDQLRKMAAEANFSDPSDVKSASGLAREIIVEYLENLQTDSIQQDVKKQTKPHTTIENPPKQR